MQTEKREGSALTYISAPSIKLIWLNSQSAISREANKAINQHFKLGIEFWSAQRRTEADRITTTHKTWQSLKQLNHNNKSGHSDVTYSADCQLATRRLFAVLFSATFWTSNLALRPFSFTQAALCLEKAKGCLQSAFTAANSLILPICNGVSSDVVSLDLIIALRGRITANESDCFYRSRRCKHCSLTTILFSKILMRP